MICFLNAQGVWGLARIELIFFTAADMRLFFVFVLNTVDNREIFLLLLGSVYTEPPHCFCNAMLASKLGVQERLGGDTDR